MAVTIHWHARSSVTLRLVHEDAGAWRGWLAEGRGDGETVDAAIAEAWRSLEAATGLRYPTIDASKLRELRRIGW